MAENIIQYKTKKEFLAEKRSDRAYKNYMDSFFKRKSFFKSVDPKIRKDYLKDLKKDLGIK